MGETSLEVSARKPFADPDSAGHEALSPGGRGRGRGREFGVSEGGDLVVDLDALA